MWVAVVIVMAFIGVMLIWWSIAVGFTFFVLPIVVCELVLLGAVYLLRQALSPEEDLREPRPSWHAAARNPSAPPGRQGGDRAGGVPGTAERAGQAPPPGWSRRERRVA